MLRKFNKAKDMELLIAGEVEAYVSSFPGSNVPLQLVSNRIRSIEENRVTCTVLDEGGPKGYVISSKRFDRDRAEIYVESIYIAPEVRGKGRVEILFNSLVEKNMDSTVSLDVSISNKSAVASYESLGFEAQRFRMIKTYPSN